jgi:hypothetical protein
MRYRVTPFPGNFRLQPPVPRWRSIARQYMRFQRGGDESAARDRRRRIATEHSQAGSHCRSTLRAVPAWPFSCENSSGVANVDHSLVTTVAAQSDRHRTSKSRVRNLLHRAPPQRHLNPYGGSTSSRAEPPVAPATSVIAITSTPAEQGNRPRVPVDKPIVTAGL